MIALHNIEKLFNSLTIKIMIYVNNHDRIAPLYLLN